MCAHLMKQYTEANVESNADAVVRKTGERGVQKCEVNHRLEVKSISDKTNDESAKCQERGRRKDTNEVWPLESKL